MAESTVSTKPLGDWLCGEFDDALFNQDAFEKQRDLVVLRGYLRRWDREVSRRLQEIHRKDPTAPDDDGGDLV